MIRKGKYTFYTDGANKIIAVSTYAGKTVRGVAKCDPRDTFDSEAGEALAQARCASKIANKRYARACKEQKKAERAVAIAQKRLEKMNAYKEDAATAMVQANSFVTSLAQGL